MMKKFLFILMIFNFTWVQAMALGCGVNCVVQDSLEKQTQDMDMAGHECCHGNKESKDETERSNCMDGFSGVCFHEIASDVVNYNDLTYKIVFFKELPVINIIKLVGINNRYLPKIPDDGFLKYKSNLNLYILKGQFLI